MNKSGSYKNTRGATAEFHFKEATPVQDKVNIELKDTVEMMTSSDYKERFTAELLQLRIRISKLAKAIENIENKTADFTPTCPIELLKAQLRSMKVYLCYLEERAIIEKIYLDDTEESKNPVTLITRDEASSLLCELANSNILAEDITDKLMEIVNIIDDEKLGYHFWGADADERVKLFTAVRADLITKEYKEECSEIANKYSFCPSDYERDEVQNAIDEAYDAWDEEE